MKTIYLVRHGETGQPAGSAPGLEQQSFGRRRPEAGAGLVLRASRVPLETIYVSDLIRTQETAAPLASRPWNGTGNPCRDYGNFFGRWDGLTFSQLRREEPEGLWDASFLTPTKADVGHRNPGGFPGQGWAALTQDWWTWRKTRTVWWSATGR